jgi:PTH1 family peptidyl-tRNA hydrolase
VSLRLCVGLGNPGPRYAMTRHNMGWLAIDALLEHLEVSAEATFACSAMLWGPLSWKERELLLLKPITYMNLSGKAVKAASARFSVPAEHILVIYDDVALPFGRLRLRAAGSAGGHHGMASILGAMGTLAVPRLRIGIGSPADGDVASWVLSDFVDEELAQLPEVMSRCVQAVEAWFSMDVERAVSYVNDRLRGGSS